MWQVLLSHRNSKYKTCPGKKKKKVVMHSDWKVFCPVQCFKWNMAKIERWEHTKRLQLSWAIFASFFFYFSLCALSCVPLWGGGMWSRRETAADYKWEQQPSLWSHQRQSINTLFPRHRTVTCNEGHDTRFYNAHDSIH